jgi:inner membrane protein involved in colicin E2 resistance
VNKHVAGFAATGLPLLLFFFGLREFLDIIGLVGAYMIGIEGIMIVFLYKKFVEKMQQKQMNPLLYCLALLFIAGVGLETYYFFITK